MIEAIPKPDMRVCTFTITGTAPYVQSLWAPWTASGCCGRAPGKPRLRHETDEWAGIPSNSIRAALVRAAKMLGAKSLVAVKLSIFVAADGFDAIDGTPLVRITKGGPRVVEHTVRIQNTEDVRRRSMWDPGWEAEVQVRYAAAVFTAEDVKNLLGHAGLKLAWARGGRTEGARAPWVGARSR